MSLVEKWAPILEHEGMPEIKDAHRRSVTAQLLENQVEASKRQTEALTEGAAPANVTANVDKYDPILISLVRRAMPNLIAYDVCGVQAMTGPTGLVFAMRANKIDTTKTKNAGDELFYGEADTQFTGDRANGSTAQAGTAPGALNDTVPGTYTTGRGMSTAAAEVLGATGGEDWAEAGFEIESFTVAAKSRALKASYSVELAQDLKAIHGLDAETELANILSTEVLAELNREVIRTVYATAKVGGIGLNNDGVFDLDIDSNGRWSVEKFKGLMFQIERDANAIAKETRRGRGNFVVCSSDVASALAMAGVLDYNPALQNNLQVDDTGNTFAGVLNGKYKVYIDPYATGDFYVVGYKGASAYDAGLFYCPYVPLTMYKTVDDSSFQPKLGFKTRYALAAHPFAQGATKNTQGALTANSNVWYRRVKVTHIM